MKSITHIKIVILNLIQDLQRWLLSLLNGMRGRFQIKFGMTALFNNGGFTLIELLVVVLIIGILAAVALPQYQKAVAKSRMATMLPVVKNIADALDVHYLQHGAYPTTDLDGLDISLPDDCTPVERQGYLTFACGNDFVLDMTKGVSRANYCPKKNTSWNDCNNNREFQIALIGIYFGDDRRGKRLCIVKNNSNLGKQICANLAGFECSGC